MKNKNLIAAFLIIFNLQAFAQEADMSLIPYRQANLWGYADPDKKIVITPVFEAAEPFSEGYAAVKKGGRYGYINKAGKQVIPFKFFVAKPFRVGYFAKGTKIVTADDIDDNQKAILFAPASLRADGYEICIDTKGEAMKGCPAIPENSAPDINKSATITKEKNYSTVKQNDIFDKIIDNYKIAGIEDDYYIAVKGTNYGVFNNKFEVIIPFEYTMIKKQDLNNTVFLQVEKDLLKGVLRGNGSVSVSVDNNNLLWVNAGKNYLIVSKDGKTGIKDVDNNEIVQSNYTDIVYDMAGGFILTGNNGLKGFYFLNGYLLEPKYASIKPVSGGSYVKVDMQTGRSGFINNRGDEFFVE
jgi:hypothetical protein